MQHDTAVSAVLLDVLTAGHGVVKSCVDGLAVIICTASSNLLERTSDHITPTMRWQTFWKNSHGELSTVPWDGCVDEGYLSLHLLGEYTPASSVLCTIGLAERTCDVVRQRSSLYRQHCRHVYAMAQLLLSTILVCDRLVLAFHLSLAMSILSSRDLLLMQIQSVLFTLAFSPVERVDPHVKR